MAEHTTPQRTDGDHAVAVHESQGAVAIGESHLHESSEIELRPVLSSTFAMMAIMFVSMAIVYGAYSFWLTGVGSVIETPLQLIEQPQTAPKLQVDEVAALGAQRVLQAETAAPRVVEPGKYAAIPVDEAMRRIAESQKLPVGPDWSLKPGEQMVGGVIMTPEQVEYANTPPSKAYVDSPGGGAPGTPAPGAAAAPTAAPATAPAKPEGTKKP